MRASQVRRLLFLGKSENQRERARAEAEPPGQATTPRASCGGGLAVPAVRAPQAPAPPGLVPRLPIHARTLWSSVRTHQPALPGAALGGAAAAPRCAPEPLPPPRRAAASPRRSRRRRSNPRAKPVTQDRPAPSRPAPPRDPCNPRGSSQLSELLKCACKGIPGWSVFHNYENDSPCS